jgi:hypothetical protein
MPLQHLHLIAPADFNARLRDLMIRLEGREPRPYFDDGGLVSRG